MRQIVFFIALMCTIGTFGQNFEYRKGEKVIFIRCTDETFSIKGKEGLLLYSIDKEYWLNAVDGLLENNLTTEQLKMIKPFQLTINFYIDYKGNVVKAYFMVDNDLFSAFQEEPFKKLYRACRAIKVDLSKVRVDKPFGENNFAKFMWRVR